MRAGAAEIPLGLSEGIPMMGYGARVGAATGLHDPLHARALYLEGDASGGGGHTLIVTLEVCLLGVGQARALRDRVAEATGLARGAIWVTATHTHSGPETGLAATLAGGDAPPWTAGVFDAAVDAAIAARANAVPAKAGFASAEASIGRNRREADGVADPEIVVLRVDAVAGGTLALVFIHGTHPTVLGHENLEWSADWPGAAGARIREAFPGAMPLFLLGAHGDVDPRTRGLQDLAIAGQSVGAGFEAAETLGREVGDAVVAAAHGVAVEDLSVSAEHLRLPVPVHGGGGGEATHRENLGRRGREAAVALGLDPEAPLRVSQALSLEQERTRGLPPEEARERLARVRLFVRDRTAARIAGGLVPEVDVQLLRIGSARWLGLPAEATAELGLAWKSGRGPGSALLSNVGGWLRYLPHPDRFAAAQGHHHYEVLMSTLEPGASLKLLAAGASLDPA